MLLKFKENVFGFLFLSANFNIVAIFVFGVHSIRCILSSDFVNVYNNNTRVHVSTCAHLLQVGGSCCLVVIVVID